MSDQVTWRALATVEEAGPVGMVSLRCDLGAPELAAALGALGLSLPGQRRIVVSGQRSVGWMSPDEMLLVVPYDDVAAVLGSLGTALAGQHHLAVDVSDARAVLRLRGTGAREVLAKLCPVDLHPDAFGPGELRRTRAAQVAAAFWMTEDEAFTVVCFRSVGQYLGDLLRLSAAPGSEIGIY